MGQALFMQKMMKDMVPICYKNVKLGLYEIDEYGNIWSNYKNDYLKPNKDKNGYLKIKLSGGSRNNPCYVRIATLVAWHFLGEPKNLKDPTINHIDGNILNNHYSNLEWIERGINSSIRKNKGIGSKNHQSKLNEEQVKEICELLVNTELSIYSIGKKFNVSASTINNILSQKTWKNISTKYNFNCRTLIRDSKGILKTYNSNLHEGVK